MTPPAERTLTVATRALLRGEGCGEVLAVAEHGPVRDDDRRHNACCARPMILACTLWHPQTIHLVASSGKSTALDLRLIRTDISADSLHAASSGMHCTHVEIPTIASPRSVESSASICGLL
jgi:hypothetical protein